MDDGTVSHNARRRSSSSISYGSGSSSSSYSSGSSSSSYSSGSSSSSSSKESPRPSRLIKHINTHSNTSLSSHSTHIVGEYWLLVIAHSATCCEVTLSTIM
ncbi:hypothetical protein ElyMa_003095700 [Elysia marginata]|uniref:REJ domain-containing protein n=1 Tax=Elysia marginata TaxID=1093978 RepID=A0AAV4IQZ9_9GAST|nr:hypothetical protein ElyMa_003095700 [Elysia marginata]